MKKFRLNRFAKLNGRLTVITNIVSIILSVAYTCAIFDATSDEERFTLILMIVPAICLILTMHWSIAKYFNIQTVAKYNYQRVQDSQKLEKMFDQCDATNVDNIKKLTSEMASITSRYQE